MGGKGLSVIGGNLNQTPGRQEEEVLLLPLSLKHAWIH